MSGQLSVVSGDLFGLPSMPDNFAGRLPLTSLCRPLTGVAALESVKA